MNTYEQMFLDDVRKLKGIIGDLLEEQIGNNDKEPEELKEIRKVIDFRFCLTAYCSFETISPAPCISKEVRLYQRNHQGVQPMNSETDLRRQISR